MANTGTKRDKKERAIYIPYTHLILIIGRFHLLLCFTITSTVWVETKFQEEATFGAKGPTVPAALRGLGAPELEIKIGQMVQGGHGWCVGVLLDRKIRGTFEGGGITSPTSQNICNAKQQMFPCDFAKS